MPVTVGKQFQFSASHVLTGLLPGHKCGRLHGHTYQVKVELTGELDPVGFVIDFAELDDFSQQVRDALDHRHLNDVLRFNPTSELLAGWISGTFKTWLKSRHESERVSGLAVTVSEGPSTWAIHRESLADASPSR